QIKTTAELLMAGTESDMTPMEAKAPISGNRDAIPARSPQDSVNEGTTDGDTIENQGLAQDGMMMTNENDQSQTDTTLVSLPERMYQEKQVTLNGPDISQRKTHSRAQSDAIVQTKTQKTQALKCRPMRKDRNHRGSVGRYDFEWGKGKDPDDQMAYYPKYKAWGRERTHFAPILFIYNNENYAYPDYPIRDWYDEGKIVLGPVDTPILDWKHLPLTISYGAKGLEMEALLRHDIRSTMWDLRDRMPGMLTDQKEMERELKNLISRMNMARLR
ncbi:MAG: hypothetical protein Q9226_005131, partial [Calogaya cf. arnoldii]